MERLAPRLGRNEMRQIVALRERIFASVGANVGWSSVIILLLVAASPPLRACDSGTVVTDSENNPGLVTDCNPDYSPRKHKMSKRARHVESDQRVTGYPQKTAETRPG